MIQVLSKCIPEVTYHFVLGQVCTAVLCSQLVSLCSCCLGCLQLEALTVKLCLHQARRKVQSLLALGTGPFKQAAENLHQPSLPSCAAVMLAYSERDAATVPDTL